MRRIVLGSLLLIAGLVAGFIVMLRGCLSKYDERSATGPSCYFEKNGQAVIFSLVKLEKATSYSSNRGITHKTVNTIYYVQANDAVTANKIADRKIKQHGNPVGFIGASQDKAWVFLGELMAFDPFSLAQLADTGSLEELNPGMKGKFPVERRYYRFDDTDKSIHITALDGSLWKLDTRSLKISPDTAQPGDDDDPAVAALEVEIKQVSIAMDSLLEQKVRRPSQLIANRKITMDQYNRMIHGFNKERSALYARRDSLQHHLSVARKQAAAQKDLLQNRSNLKGKLNVSFGQMKSNMDTLNGNWYGLYTPQEIDKLYERIRYQPAHGDAARRSLYKSNFLSDRSGEYVVVKENKSEIPLASPFLDGGFLLDKNSGRPAVLASPLSYLVVSKTQIGNEGKILVTRLTPDGKTVWSFDTQLKDWADWIITRDHLYIFGNDNRELSSSSLNVLYCLQLSSGKVSAYDFFTDKMR